MKKATNIFLIIIGTISLILGIIGIVVPLLPTTPFLLLTAGCYYKGSPKLYRKLITNSVLGKYIKNYREKKAIPLKVKIVAITMLWLSISYSAIFIIPYLLVKILLFIIAIGVTYHILRLKTLKKFEY